MEPGVFYLGASVDSTQPLIELREDNNARADLQLAVLW